MPSIAEALASNSSQMASTLAAGVETIALQQHITFTKYVRVVLPLDGFVFWVRADLLGAEALQNATVTGPTPVAATATFTATGSLHQVVDRKQEEDGTIGVNTIILTSETEIQPLNEVSPVIMFLGAFEGVRFAFARRNTFYRQADLHHYVGEAVYPVMESQIIDAVAQISQRAVVSNSLPAWLALNSLFPVYPAFLVPENLRPPYAVAMVASESTRALQAQPVILSRDSTHYQLVSERVKITLYGVRNDQALDYQDMVNEFSLNTDIIGVMNMPVFRDERRTQAELPALAIKKSIEWEISYYQARVNDIARQAIIKAIPTVTVNW